MSARFPRELLSANDNMNCWQSVKTKLPQAGR
jgi:hypothetical protein